MLKERALDKRLPWNWVLYYGEVVQAGDGRRELYGGMIRVDVRKSLTWGTGPGISIGVRVQLGSWCECINIISG